jgi:RimJ/RimL family protein N-acetyltransferase
MRTERLLFSPWTESDWLALKPIATDPEVMRYISEGLPWPDDRIQGFVARQMTCLRERGFCTWSLLEPATDQMIGFCGLQPLANTPDIEIGWWLARSHWGRGLATEAARAVLRDGFERAGLDRIVAVAQPGNGASRRVMEKLGMRYECDTQHKGVDVVLYAIQP